VPSHGPNWGMAGLTRSCAPCFGATGNLSKLVLQPSLKGPSLHLRNFTLVTTHYNSESLNCHASV
jgi:hypothetical protein